MAVDVQDDKREKELRKKFGLQEHPDRKRGGTDGILMVDKLEVPFEIKSTSKGSITTVRDFGPNHLKSWKNKHWLIGFYSKKGNALTLSEAYYGTPSDMKEWIDGKSEYVRRDFELAEKLAPLVTDAVLVALCGDKKVYSLDDAKSLQQKQYKKAEYLDKMDNAQGYSRARMLEMLRGRVIYLISRGSTLNNPHIPGEYVRKHCKRVKSKADLALLVQQATS